jgi:hypothetical protein
VLAIALHGFISIVISLIENQNSEYQLFGKEFSEK